MDAPFALSVPIRFSHTDPAGIVYFPNYFDFCNAAVEDLYGRALGIDYAKMIFEGRRAPPIVRAECDFFAPSQMGDTLELAVLLGKIGRTSIEIEFFGHVGRILRLKARLVTVHMDLETRRSTPIPESLRARFDAYKAACAGWIPPVKEGTPA
ncbi:MAG: acyl-CoA thioesterase [Tagaea sp.]